MVGYHLKACPKSVNHYTACSANKGVQKSVGCAQVMILMRSDRKVRVTVLLDESLMQRFDAYCAEKGYKKSPLIAPLVRDHLGHESFQQTMEFPIDRGRNEE